MSNSAGNTSRPKRSVNQKKNEKNDLLNMIKDSKESGKNLKQDTEVEDVFVYMNDDKYHELVERRRQENIVEGDSEYYDDGREIYEDSDDAVEEDEIQLKNLKRHKSKKVDNAKKTKYHNSDALADSKSAKLMKNFINEASKFSKGKKTESGNLQDLLQQIGTTKEPTSNPTKISSPFPIHYKSKQLSIHKPTGLSQPNKTVKTPVSISDDKRKKVDLNSNKNNASNNREIISIKSDQKVRLNSDISNIEKTDKTPASISDTKRRDISINSNEININNNQETVNMKSENKTSLCSNNNKIEPSVLSQATKESVEKSDADDMDSIDFSETINETMDFDDNDNTKTTSKDSIWMTEESDEKNDKTTMKGKINFNPKDDTSNLSERMFYWLDAYHDKKIDGVVFLFGKMFINETKSYVNACVRVSKLKRRIYILPNDGCDMKEVFNEVKVVLNKYRMEDYRFKVVSKKYAFQFADVPDEGEYLMVEYDCKYPELPNTYTGKTISRIFGTNTTCLENFIMDLKLKGPCWLSFDKLETTNSQFSTCTLNFEVSGIKGIAIAKGPIPPICVLSLNLKTVEKSNTSQIVSIGCFIHERIFLDQPPPTEVFQHHFTIIAPPKVMDFDMERELKKWGDKYKNFVTTESNERSLINKFLAKLQRLDPDLIVGHSLFGYQLEILLLRCQALNITIWSKLGRLKRQINLPKITGKSSGWVERMATAGRIICDTAVSARELVKCRSYDQHELVKEILPKKFHGLQNSESFGDIIDLFNDSIGVKTLIDFTLDEAVSNLHLMHELQILPLALEITTICGNLLSRTLSSGKSERNEYLLLHAFHEKNYLVPDKPIHNQDHKSEINDDGTNEHESHSKRKPTYSGGLVLEPKRGFYENFILLMDFNSLYPSIIQEFNICFTTIDRRIYLKSNEIKSENSNEESNREQMMQQMEMLMGLSRQASSQPAGILPTEIRKLVESRKSVKKLLNIPNLSMDKKMQYDIRQKALKITANSMYGCLGFSHSRFQATQLAALVTCHGREILLETKQFVSSGSINLKDSSTKLVLDIIYGDTDSIMVNTGINNPNEYDKVMKIGQKIKEEVNKLHREIQLDIDGVLRKILLLNKKKYAALTVVRKNQSNGQLITKQELKGLDIVRRDWCKLSVEVGKCVLTKILEEEMSPEDLAESIHTYLKSVSEDIRNGNVKLDKFVITKALTRNPEKYSNSQGQPHVQVAMRLNNSRKVKKYRAKDTVEYVICVDGTTQNSAQRAYHLQELLDAQNNNPVQLRIDFDYYLAHQLHPVISRLVDSLEGISSATVAEHLGLDPKAYTSRTLVIKEENNEMEDSAINGINRFIDCKPLMVKCNYCATSTPINCPLGPSDSWCCDNCKKDLISSGTDAIRISKQLVSTIRKYVHNYYSQVFFCQELECNYACRELPIVSSCKNEKVLNKTGQFICPHCGTGIMRTIMTDSQLYNQLLFFNFIFSPIEKLQQRYMDALTICRKAVARFLSRSDFSRIRIKKLFSEIARSKLAFEETD